MYTYRRPAVKAAQPLTFRRAGRIPRVGSMQDYTILDAFVTPASRTEQNQFDKKVQLSRPHVSLSLLVALHFRDRHTAPVNLYT